jgi:serine/threonine protein kinase
MDASRAAESERSRAVKRLRLQLIAHGYEGLFELLEPALGQVIANRYILTRIMAVGQQSIVFQGVDLESKDTVVIKQPAFDYRRPILCGVDLVAKRRASLKMEANVLQASAPEYLPAFIEYLEVPSPIPASRESLHLTTETFLVQEYVEGVTLKKLALELWRQWEAPVRERIALTVTTAFVRFWITLFDHGYCYCDISSTNLLWEQKSLRLRIVDGGSVTPAAEWITDTGFTPAFTTPLLFSRLRKGEGIRGGLESFLPQLAKILHFMLTYREPIVGQIPELWVDELHDFSGSLIDTLSGFLNLDREPESLPAALELLRLWSVRLDEGE